MTKTDHIIQLVEEMLSRLPSEAKLPSLRDMQKDYGVSMTTLNRAFEVLQERGLVRLVQGSGIYSTRQGGMMSRPSTVEIFYFGNEGALNDPGYVRDLLHHLSVLLGEQGIGTTVSMFPCRGALGPVQEVLNRRECRAVMSVFMDNLELCHELDRRHIAHVAITPDLLTEVPNGIYIDNFGGMELIVRNLVARNHRRIAYLHGDTPAHYSRDLYERRMAFYQLCMKYGLSTTEELVRFSGNDAGVCRKVLEDMLDGATDVTAVIANDAYMPELYDALRSRGLQPGKDIALCGIDDVESNLSLRPRLSGTCIPRQAIAHAALELLLKLSHGSQTQVAQHILPVWSDRETTPMCQ